MSDIEIKNEFDSFTLLSKVFDATIAGTDGSDEAKAAFHDFVVGKTQQILNPVTVSDEVDDVTTVADEVDDDSVVAVDDSGINVDDVDLDAHIASVLAKDGQ